MANQIYSCPTEGSTTVRLHNTSFVPPVLRWPTMANYSSLIAPQAVPALLMHNSSLMAFPTSRSDSSVSMKAHIHDAFFETCQVGHGFSSTLAEGSTTVFLHHTCLPGVQWASSAGYSHLATHQSSPPLSASMVAHCWPTQMMFPNPTNRKTHIGHFAEILSPSLTTHCTFKWSPRAVDARRAAGCRKRRGNMLDGGEGRKRRKLDADESELQAGPAFSSVEPENTSMLSHTLQELSHQQGVSMVAHCSTYSFPSSSTSPTQTGILSLASHIAPYHSEVSTALMSLPAGSLLPSTSLVSHMTFFCVSPTLGHLQPSILALPPSPGPRGTKRAADDVEVFPFLFYNKHRPLSGGSRA